MQRVMFVPKPFQVVTSLDHARGLHAARQRSSVDGDKSGLFTPIEQSCFLIAYMAWPNDEIKRNEWLAAVEGAALSQPEGGAEAIKPTLVQLLARPAMDAKGSEIEKIQPAWNAVADVYQRLVDTATEEGLKIRGGPSIAKAIELCLLDKQFSRAQMERFWSKYRDVAHLLAAAAFLNDDGALGGILTAAWISPDAVIGIADGLEHFGLSYKSHGSTDSFLPFQTTWRLPEYCCKEPPFLVRRALLKSQREHLQNRKARKQYLSKY